MEQSLRKQMPLLNAFDKANSCLAYQLIREKVIFRALIIGYKTVSVYCAKIWRWKMRYILFYNVLFMTI